MQDISTKTLRLLGINFFSNVLSLDILKDNTLKTLGIFMYDLRQLDILPYIPHRPPMLMVTSLVRADKDEIIAEYNIGENCLFLKEDNSLEHTAYVEVLAQAFAAGTGYIRNKKELDLGFLAAIRDVKIVGKAYLSDVLTAKVSVIAELEGIIVVQGELFCTSQGKQSHLIASSQFKVFLPDEKE